MESLFNRLYKKIAVQEDFITEALSGVLKSIPIQTLIELFALLGLGKLPFSSPSFETQKSTSSGRNDLVITDNGIIIVFENKWDSPTYLEQLHRYDRMLCNENKEWKFLVHLTKDYGEIKDTFRNPFVKMNWSDVYNALRTFESANKYLIEEFLLFLKEEGIAMEKVSWEIVNGSRSVYNLTRIICRACQELGTKCVWSTTSADYTSQWIDNRLGAYFLLDKGHLLFTSSNPQPSIPEMNIQWKNSYAIRFDFDEKCFFHKNLEAQVETIKEFIKELLSKMEIKQP